MTRARRLRRTALTALAAAATTALVAAPAGAGTVRPVTSFAPAGVEGLSGIAVDQSTGAVYVTGRSSGNVEKFSASGIRDGSFVSPELSFPSGVAVDNSSESSKGDVYVAEFTGETVVKLDAAGQEVAGFTPLTAGSFPAGDPGSEVFKPFSVAVDPTDGDLVVGDRTNGEVDIFSSSGVFVSQFAVEGVFGVAVGAGKEILTASGAGAQAWSPLDGYSTPTAIGPASELHAVAADLASGDVFADGEGQVTEYDSAGTPLLQFGAGLLEEASFGVAAAEASNTIYVTELGGSVYAFGAPVTLAEATTGTPATGVTSTSANLGGTVDPDGTTVTSCRFEYGLSTTYGSSATCAPNAPLTGNTTIPVATGLQGLQPNETYHYRLAATNAQGTGYGEDQTLTTSAASPTIGGQSVSGITQTTAILNAQIDPNNQATSYHFQYGTSSAYGSEAPIPDATIGSGYGNTNVGQPLTGLKPDTTYHYRVVASNASSPSGGTAGSDQTFTTPPVLPPVVTTGQAEGVAQNAATLTGTIDTQGFQTTYEFDLGTDTSYGTRIFGNAGTEPGPQAYIAALQGLMPGTTYHYRIVATSTFGTAYGPDQTFTTTSYSSATLIAPASVPLVPAPLLTITDTTTTSTKTITAKAAGVRHAAHPAKRNHTDKQTGKPRKRHRVRTQSINAKRVRNVNRGGSKR